MDPTGAHLPLAQVQQFLLESTPVASIAHSHHVDALMDPALARDPAFQGFSLIELNELHHQVAAMGDLLRIQQGETSALAGLARDLAAFLQNRELAMETARRLPPPVLHDPSVQRMLAAIQHTNQQLQRYLPAIQRVIAAAGVASPGPLLVRCP